ncbi:MAG TPA: alpha/beta fold hydrolase [Actinomycetota bacterium]|jgi:pimeloyl-ACP methyl ester carboxylesterase
MDAPAHHVEELDLHLTSGRVHAARLGGQGPLVVCLPGLSANLRSFDVIGRRLADGGFHVVVLDLRGRGRSETTPPGTYGWPAHAADAAEVAQRLGARSMHLVGWSMGAFVAMQLATMEPQLLDKVVLLDACGATSERAEALIRLVIERLGVVHPSFRQYVELVRQTGAITPWDPLWERYFAYELEPAEGGVRARTSRGAVTEDFEYGTSHDPRRLWPGLTMPALLVRAARPLVPRGPFIVSARDRDAFARGVPQATVVEVDANHYGVITHPGTADAIVEFLAGEPPRGSRG